MQITREQLYSQQQEGALKKKQKIWSTKRERERGGRGGEGRRGEGRRNRTEKVIIKSKKMVNRLL